MVMAIFRDRRANRIPMQFLGPAPKGRYTYGFMASLFSLLNLDNDMVGEQNEGSRKYISILLFQRSLSGGLWRLD